MTLAAQLAEFLRGTAEVPPRITETAARAVFDLVAAAVAGYGTPGARAARRAAGAAWGAGPAQIWFGADRLTGPGGAFANSAASSMLDLDDGHRAAAGHPGASIIPAVLAARDQCGAGADRVLTAIALGYDVAVRIAAARELDRLDTLVSGPWCGQGAAAAAAWLRGFSAGQIAQAIAIADATAPNLAAVAYSRMMGNHVKEGIPWATATGMAAVELAGGGFTGPLDCLDNAALYDARTLTGGLGERWHIEGIYFKPYSCCRWAHAAIDAVIGILAEEGVPPDTVEAIEIDTFARALQLNNDLEPTTLEAAQYSVPFCVALAAVRGPNALLPLRESSLGDQAVLALARRVTLRVDPALDAMFSRAVPARVTLAAGGSRFVRCITAPRGEPTNPMGMADLAAKFEAATRGLVDPGFASAAAAAATALGGGDIGPLHALLALPLTDSDTRTAAGTDGPLADRAHAPECSALERDNFSRDPRPGSGAPSCTGE